MISHQVYLLSLGCAKNLVDSEVMSGAFIRSGFVMTEDPECADVIVVNTCGFLESARAEGIEALLSLAQYKEEGNCKMLVAVGCMPQLFGDEMAECMPEIDLFIGVGRYTEIPGMILEKLGEQQCADLGCGDGYLFRELSQWNGSAYLKIAEGCDNCCAYCLIPKIRGSFVSRPMEDILEEAQHLLDQNVRELVLIAQDCGRYGLDRYGKRMLAELLDQIAELPFDMIRLLYVYPDLVDRQLLDVMNRHSNICHYLDMPIQHSCGSVLKAMNRRGDTQSLLEKVREIRSVVPDMVLRTTVMLGFPGETEENFDELVDFLSEAKFDWLGAFAFSPEEGTPAAEMADQIDNDTKQHRLEIIMEQAMHVTEQKLADYVGKELAVLADFPDEDNPKGMFVGRSQYQAPDVDGVIYFTGENVQPGEMYKVRITAQDIYDLIGEVVE